MDCSEAARLVERFADGELGEAQRREVEAHLAVCAACRAHLEGLRTVDGRFAGALPEPPEGYFDELPGRVLARIGSAPASGSSSIRSKLLAPDVLRWEALAAVLVVAVAVGVVATRDGVVEPTAVPAASPAPAQEEKLDEAPEAEGLASTREEDSAEPPSGLADVPPAPRPARDRREQEQSRQAPSALALERSGRTDASKARAAEAEDRVAASAYPFVAEDDCDAWRRILGEAVPESAEAGDVRYELARCSLERHEREGSEESRETAIEEAEAFLEATGDEDNPRARDIREALERIR